MPRLKPEAAQKRVLYKITEVIKITGRSRSTIHRWLEAGILQGVPIPGGLRMVDADSVERLQRGEAPKPKRKKTQAQP